jgi:hypothetical protein
VGVSADKARRESARHEILNVASGLVPELVTARGDIVAVLGAAVDTVRIVLCVLASETGESMPEVVHRLRADLLFIEAREAASDTPAGST